MRGKLKEHSRYARAQQVVQEALNSLEESYRHKAQVINPGKGKYLKKAVARTVAVGSDIKHW
jgi:hypothetical protein